MSSEYLRNICASDFSWIGPYIGTNVVRKGYMWVYDFEKNVGAFISHIVLPEQSLDNSLSDKHTKSYTIGYELYERVKITYLVIQMNYSLLKERSVKASLSLEYKLCED